MAPMFHKKTNLTGNAYGYYMYFTACGKNCYSRIRSQVSALRNIFQMYVLQISNIGLTLNPRAGERAILTKNFEGDWGLVTGKWIGFKNGVAGRKGTLSLSICFGCHALSAVINIKDYHLDMLKLFLMSIHNV